MVARLLHAISAAIFTVWLLGGIAALATGGVRWTMFRHRRA